GLQALDVCSVTRPVDPFDGSLILETDASRLTATRELHGELVRVSRFVVRIVEPAENLLGGVAQRGLERDALIRALELAARAEGVHRLRLSLEHAQVGLARRE